MKVSYTVYSLEDFFSHSQEVPHNNLMYNIEALLHGS